MRSSRKIALAAVATLLAVVGRAPAQVLDQTPAGALVIVKVRNLAETNTKVAQFLKDLGVDQFSPALGDPLAALKTKLNIQQGLDEKGEMEFAFIDPAVSGADEDHSSIFLIPVTDYKAFTGNFADAKTEGDITTVQLPDNPEPSYVTNWGKFAAIGQSKEVLAKKPDGSGLKVKGLAAKELTDKDAVVYVNMDALRAKVLPEMKTNHNQWVDQATSQLEGDKAKYVPLAKAAVNEGLTIAEGYLEQTESVTWGIALEKDGIHTTLVSEFQAGTYGGDSVKMVKNTDEAMLAGLPNSKFVFYGGAVTTPELSTKLMDDLLTPLLPEITKLGDEGKPMLSYIDGAKKFAAAGKGAAFGVLTPSGMIGQDSLLQMLEIIHGDSKVIGQSQLDMVQNQQELMKLFQPNAELQTKVTVTPAAKTVDGVTLDQIQTDFSADPNNPQGQNIEQAMRTIYGPDGLKILTGSVDADTRVFALSAPDDALQSLITAAKAKDDTLAKSDAVAGVAGQLPKQRVAAGYWAVDSMITVGLKYASAMGMNLPINLPPNQPPVGMTLATDGTAVRVDTFVPTQLVKTITSAVIAFTVHMQGGGGGGGGAGPGL